MPRPRSDVELTSVRKEVVFKPSEIALLKRALSPGGKLGTFIREAALRAAADDDNDKQPHSVPLLGYIAAGNAMDVCPFPPGSSVTPPFTPCENGYVLAVIGTSMEDEEHENCIYDGSYALFCRDQYPVYGAIVHAEWPGPHGENVCTLKRYEPQRDGSARFVPLNKKHKPIVRKPGEYEIRGVYARSWDEVEHH